MLNKTTIRKVGSFFFLGLFLWFYSVKDIHDIIHADDAHPHFKYAQNIQTPGHHCLICDFHFPCFNDQVTKIEIGSHRFYIRIRSTPLIQVVSKESVSLFSSRAPPVVA